MRAASGWLAAADLIAEARAALCLPCNGQPGPCTCRRARTACRCGCPREQHERWRATTYCARCGYARCPYYRRRRKTIFPWRRA